MNSIVKTVNLVLVWGSWYVNVSKTDTRSVVSVKPGRVATLADPLAFKKDKAKSATEEKKNRLENPACCLLPEPLVSNNQYEANVQQ